MCCDSVTDENTNIRGSRQYRRNRLRDILCIINEIFLGSICLGSGCESRSSTGSTVARTTIDSRRICRNHSRGKTSSPALFLQCFPREEWPKETFKESQRPLSQCALQKSSKKDDFGIKTKLPSLRWICQNHRVSDKFHYLCCKNCTLSIFYQEIRLSLRIQFHRLNSDEH